MKLEIEIKLTNQHKSLKMSALSKAKNIQNRKRLKSIKSACKRLLEAERKEKNMKKEIQFKLMKLVDMGFEMCINHIQKLSQTNGPAAAKGLSELRNKVQSPAVQKEVYELLYPAAGNHREVPQQIPREVPQQIPRQHDEKEENEKVKKDCNCDCKTHCRPMDMNRKPKKH